MVPGEVHMSDTPSGPHPIIPRTIRLAAIPILLCWLGFTVFRQRRRSSVGGDR